jgi:phosphoadenosine phosphosulfate reductase
MSLIKDTFAALEKTAKKHPKVLVSYSGGKDSLATLDMCLKTFEHVEAFFMYLIEGLRSDAISMQYATARGVKIRYYPHWILFRMIKTGAYCLNTIHTDNLPDTQLRDILDLAKHESGIDIIAHGAKNSDSLWRKRNLAATHYEDVIYPLLDWRKEEVIAYLKSNKIPYPKDEKKGVTINGLDLTRQALLALHDRFPDDFKKLCVVFPFAEAIIWHRKWYGESSEQSPQDSQVNREVRDSGDSEEQAQERAL